MQGSKVMHQSRAGTLAPEEPDELIAHVRVCGGAGWVTTGSTRKPTPNSLRSYLALAIGRGSPRALGTSNKRINLYGADREGTSRAQETDGRNRELVQYEAGRDVQRTHQCC